MKGSRSGARRASSRTFTTTASLVAWMEDEYLSQLTFEGLEVEPAGAAPSRVRFVWRLHGIGNGQSQPYRIEARGVTAFDHGPPLGTGELSVTVPDDAAGGVSLAMETASDRGGERGRLRLVCEELVVTRGARSRKKAKRRPWTDYAYFSLHGARAPSIAETIGALGIPDRAELVGQPPITREDTRPLRRPTVATVDVRVDGALWITFYCRPGRTDHDFDLVFVRRGCTDAEWNRVQHVARSIACERVRSSWELDCSPAEWLEIVGGT